MPGSVKGRGMPRPCGSWYWQPLPGRIW